MLLVMLLLTGIAYPLAITGLAQTLFPKKPTALCCTEAASQLVRP
jgi:K+-transporting ATPase c subunit